MCGGFVGDIIDTVGDVVEDVGDFIGDTVEAIVDDPLQAIVTVGAMAAGVPPVWAGALGGAAGAAEHGGNVLEGALLGGAAGYVGGVASGAAAGAGAGQILSSAAGGAAAGATVGALTGGDIIKSALTGAAGGALAGTAVSYFNGPNGTTTYTYDDGSTVTYNADGSAVSSTAATDGSLAPVYEFNPSTGKVELVQQGTGSNTGSNTLPVAFDNSTGQVRVPTDLVSTGYSDSAPGTIYNGPNGPEIVLDSGKTVNLFDYQQAIANGSNLSIDGQMVASDTPYRVEVSGLPGTAENPSYAKSDLMNPNSRLATFDEIDAGQATWNPEANAWEIGADIQTGTGTDGYVAQVTVNPDGSTSTVNRNGSITTTFANGTSLTSMPDGTYVTHDASGHISTGTSGSESSGGIDTGNGTTYVYDDGSTITIHPDGTSTSTPAPGDEFPTTDTTTPTTNVPNTDLTVPTDGTLPYNPVTGVPTVTPIFPINGPTTPKTPGVDDTYTPPQIGNLTKPNTDIGLSPGFIKPTPFYDTTNDVQNQYYWGSHGFQTGDTFNPQQYNVVPTAPQNPFGIDEAYQQLTPQEVAAIVQNPAYQAQFGAVSGPIVPNAV